MSGSLDRLGLDYLDLYLIHWPLPRLALYAESYETMLELAAEGLIRSVGVSNFKPAHIAALVEATGVTPALDQIELSPRCRAGRPSPTSAARAWSPRPGPRSAPAGRSSGRPRWPRSRTLAG